MMLFRRLLGDVLRRHRQEQGRTLREVATAARISLGYLSEVERGRKEASSELLSSLCEALGLSLADVLREVSDDIAVLEGRRLVPVGFGGGVSRTPQLAPRAVAGLVPGVPTRVVTRAAVAPAMNRPPAPVTQLLTTISPVAAA